MTLDPAFFERYLDADIPRDAPVMGTVSVRVARALAAALIMHCPDPDCAVRDLESCADFFDRNLVQGAGYSHRGAAEILRQCLAFIRDEQRHNAELKRAS